MSLTNYGPGKFNLNIDAYVYTQSLDGCGEQIGDVSEDGIVYLMVDGPFEPKPDEIEEYGLSAEDVHFLKVQQRAILSENDQGFVEVEYYENGKHAMKNWRQIEKQMTASY